MEQINILYMQLGIIIGLFIGMLISPLHSYQSKRKSNKTKQNINNKKLGYESVKNLFNMLAFFL